MSHVTRDADMRTLYCCIVVSYHVISKHVMTYHIMTCHIMPCHIMTCHIMTCHIMIYHNMTQLAIPHHSRSCSMVSHIMPRTSSPNSNIGCMMLSQGEFCESIVGIPSSRVAARLPKCACLQFSIQVRVEMNLPEDGYSTTQAVSICVIGINANTSINLNMYIEQYIFVHRSIPALYNRM